MNDIKKIWKYIITFASQRLVFEEKNKQLLLENSSNLSHEFLYNNFNKIFFYQSCHSKILIKFDAFLRRNGSFIPQKQGVFEC